MNFYEILEVSPNASQEVLKAAYKSLMQRYHPDKNPGNEDAAAHSATIVRAYEILSDTSKRTAYDIELKRQSEQQNSIQIRPRKVQNLTPVRTRNGVPGSLVWLLIATTAWAIWHVVAPSEDKQSPSPITMEANSRTETSPPDIQQNKVNEQVPSIEARTIPRFIQDINVNLEAMPEYSPASENVAKHILTIQTLGIVVGTFDSDKFIYLIQDNKELIRQRLTERLASAKYEMLIKPNGEQYLKQLILDIIGEITGTNRYQVYPSVGTGAPAHYGVVDILLAESFSIKSLKVGKPKTDEESKQYLP